MIRLLLVAWLGQTPPEPPPPPPPPPAADPAEPAPEAPAPAETEAPEEEPPENGSSSDADSAEPAPEAPAPAETKAPEEEPPENGSSSGAQPTDPDPGSTPPDPNPDDPASDASPNPTPEDSASDPQDVTSLPELITFSAAPYPARASEEGIEAEVILEIDIDAEGQVEGATVVVPADPPGYGFDEAAMNAVAAFVFKPAYAGDLPVPVRITYKYRFTLEQPAAAEEPAEPDPNPADTEPGIVNFQGVLLERGTRIPLAGVIITVFQGEGEDARGFETTSDTEGKFSFFDLEPGTWKVLSEPEGYYPLRTAEVVRTGERVEATYYIEKASYNPFDVLVKAPRPRKEVSRTSLDIAEIDKVPGTFGDVLAVVQNLPGVARAPAASGLIIVRGSAPEDTQVFVDEISVPLIYHFFGLRSVVPVGMLDGIDFYPGNYSPFYGRATGGILDVSLKQKHPEKWGGYVDVSLLDTGIFFETPIGEKASIAIAGRRSYIDFILNAAVPDDADVNLLTAPRYYDFQLSANYRPTSAHQFRAFFLGSDDQLRLLFENPGDADAELRASSLDSKTRFYRGWLTHRFAPNDSFQNELKIAGGPNFIDFRLGQDLFFDLNFFLGQARDTAQWKINELITLVGGIDYLFAEVDVDINLPSPPKRVRVRSEISRRRFLPTNKIDGFTH